ncbi:MAG: hypothetical protein WDO74_14645 [Pseudomonadota bacterium]
MSILGIRKGERREAWTAFSALFALIASNSVLETARDALFLSRVAAARLPWVFLVTAVLSVGLVKVNERLTRGFNARGALSLVAWTASAITLGFFVFHWELGVWGLYALYVWSGLLGTFTLVHFWDLVGSQFTITQAKRLYAFIGAGSVLGAIAGSGAASVLSRGVSPVRLVLVSALGLAVAGLIPLLSTSRSTPAQEIERTPTWRDTLAYLVEGPYTRRVVVALCLAAVCLTLSDFVFKSEVAALVPQTQLGAFLGSVYFGVNVLALVCQLVFVAWSLRRLSLGAASSILPALLFVSGLGVVATGALATVVALKLADGSLRASLHRTIAELLVLPFGEKGGPRAKAFIDLVGQRGGQVLASLTILGLTAIGVPPRVLALMLVVLAGLWFAYALSLRTPYVAVFRARLNAGRSSHVEEFPELDLSSLETLLGAFESSNDREVLAALRALERENKPQLVPALLLHHPSEQVVLKVLAIITRSGRKAAVSSIDRILDHESPAVRAAALAARSVLEPDPDWLRERLAGEESAPVRGAIAANLVVAGTFDADERERELDRLLQDAASGTQIALADAIGRRGATGFDQVLIQLLGAKEAQVQRAAVVAMGQVASPALLPALVDALAEEATRHDAELALVAHGGAAFEVLRQRFEDTSTDTRLRWRLPQAMALCSAEQTVLALVSWLSKEPNGAVRFGILLVLERLVRQQPNLPLDRALLKRSVHQTITRAYTYLDARLLLSRGAARDESRKTPGHGLLHDLLRDKQISTRGRLFRLLSLLHPTEDFGQIYRSLSLSKDQRVTAMELVESILREPIRSAVLGLIEDCTDEQRLARAGRFHRPWRLGYEALLTQLFDAESDSVRQVALFHARELGLPGVAGGAARAA